MSLTEWLTQGAGFAYPAQRGLVAGLVIFGRRCSGNNFFGAEAAAIRKIMSPAYIDVRELSCVELGELARALDTLRPGVLHVAAHSSFGGVFFSLGGSPLSVGYDAFTETVERSFSRGSS